MKTIKVFNILGITNSVFRFKISMDLNFGESSLFNLGFYNFNYMNNYGYFILSFLMTSFLGILALKSLF